jgi:site-specific recombinase XerD
MRSINLTTGSTDNGITDNPGTTPVLLDARGRRRSPVSIAGYKPTTPPATKGRTYPPEPLPVEDIVALMQACVPQRSGHIAELSAIRLRALIVLLWRTGLRISEALDLEARDLDSRERLVIVRRGKGGKRRISVMDEWGWNELEKWLHVRAELPSGKVFCVLSGITAGRAMESSDARRQFRQCGTRAGIRRRAHPHGLRHSHAVDLWKEGFDVYSIQLQLGHAKLDVTAMYLRGVAVADVLQPIAKRRAPMVGIGV